MQASRRIAVVGAGLGGLTVAGLLQRLGHHVTVHEQATQFGRIGAGIILSANAVKVLRHLDIEAALLRTGIRPAAFLSRDWMTGTTSFALAMDGQTEARFGAAFLNIHRADLHEILLSALAPGSLHLNHRLEAMDAAPHAVTLRFANGDALDADVVIGGDGIHSRLRALLFGEALPRFTGRMAQRAIFPTARLGGMAMDDCTKWWGPDRHALSYFMTSRRDEVYVMASVPGAHWDGTDLSRPLPRDEFLASFDAATPELRRLVEGATECAVWPICDRPRDDRWHHGRAVLLGDACHPVRPYMAAGGASAIEDAAVLSRCLHEFDAPEEAFHHYAAARIPRVAEVQRISIANTWMRGPDESLDWFFGHDAMATPLAVHA
ncbi:FAD-dependent monooxygenase [Sediminicoccus sp. KRV36]|uniref:FAD-dependent monooxygenase n=1 Tax=Sediminicoccus sp. KRV36 TaxID=3133721 RepID=UPI00200CECEA|nr:FAD-dependent monooxygenase [Sediminicoccus rosea]UPY38762.1 FAD-dependent monooxygenase [Sediminicoccus rosea]